MRLSVLLLLTLGCLFPASAAFAEDPSLFMTREEHAALCDHLKKSENEVFEECNKINRKIYRTRDEEKREAYRELYNGCLENRSSLSRLYTQCIRDFLAEVPYYRM